MNDYHSFTRELVFRRTSAMSQQFAPVAEEKENGTGYEVHQRARSWAAKEQRPDQHGDQSRSATAV